MGKIKIISVSYAMIITNEIINQIIKADDKAYVRNWETKKLGLSNSLKNKLMKRNEVIDVQYTDWRFVPGDQKGDKIVIQILSDSVTNPNKNQKYWQGIAEVINNHIFGINPC